MSIPAPARPPLLAELGALFAASLSAVTPRAAETRALGAEAWLGRTFPGYVARGFAPYHAELWGWVWSLRPGARPEPFVGVWPRGAGKSTSAELACVAAAALDVRGYALYVSATQDQADKHVDTIAAMLESGGVQREYPELGARMVGKYGNSRGWRRSRLRTASGYTVDAIGLDTAARGIKVEDRRPDFMVIDDIDQEHDTPAATEKKIVSLTQKLLPAGAPDLAVLAIQNLVLPDGVFARLANVAREPADFLRDRAVSGPHPAIAGMETTIAGERVVIAAGEPTWGGMDIPACEGLIASMGLAAFLIECQHELIARGDRIFRREWWDGRNRYDPARLGDDGWLPRRRVIHWDTAEEATASAAYSAGVVFDVQELRDTGRYRLLLRAVRRGRWELTELLREVEALATTWRYDERGQQVVDPAASVAEVRRQMVIDVLQDVRIEYASSGKSVVQTLRAAAPEWLRAILSSERPVVSKDIRGREAAVFCAADKVLLPWPAPDNAGWLNDFEAELYAVPRSKYRDQSDAFSQAVRAHRGWFADYAPPAGGAHVA